MRSKKVDWTRAATDEIVKTILGPLSRTWKRNGRVYIGFQKGGKSFYLGSGADYELAFKNVFVDTLKAKEELDREFPGWRQYDLSKLNK